MQPSDLPQTELNDLRDTILAFLEKGAGEHRRARFHVDVEGVENPELSNEFNEGMLASTDPAAKGKPFVSGNAIQPTLALLKAATKAEKTIHLLQCNFERTDLTWTYTLKVQSLNEYRAMCVERRPLEDAIEIEMLASGEVESPGWRELWLSGSPDESLKLNADIMKSGQKRLGLSDTIQQKFTETGVAAHLRPVLPFLGDVHGGQKPPASQ